MKKENKREIEELFFKPIIVSIDEMDKFEQKEMKKIRPIQSAWYDWFINYIPASIRKSAGSFKDKIVSFFRKTHLNKACMREERTKHTKNTKH